MVDRGTSQRCVTLELSDLFGVVRHSRQADIVQVDWGRRTVTVRTKTSTKGKIFEVVFDMVSLTPAPPHRKEDVGTLSRTSLLNLSKKRLKEQQEKLPFE